MSYPFPCYLTTSFPTHVSTPARKKNCDICQSQGIQNDDSQSVRFCRAAYKPTSRLCDKGGRGIGCGENHGKTSGRFFFVLVLFSSWLARREADRKLSLEGEKSADLCIVWAREHASCPWRGVGVVCVGVLPSNCC